MDLTQEEFDALLAWLDPERGRAGEIYREIQDLLIRSFGLAGFLDPEELADETINRVAKKVPEIAPSYVGEKSNYFFGTARYVQLEAQRRWKRHDELPDDDLMPAPEPPAPNLEADCLDYCLRQLSSSQRVLITGFYVGEKRAKIENRLKMAKSLKVTLANLRLQAHRIRRELKKCIEKCLQAATA